MLFRSVPDESRVRLLDTDLLLKWVLRRGELQEEHGPSIAIEAGVLTPEIAGQDRFGAQANLIISYRWTQGTVHFNEQVAYSRAGNIDLFGSVILEGSHELAVRPVAEIVAERELGETSTVTGLVGAIWSPSASLALDAGLRVGRIEDTRGAEVRLGFTWAFSVVGERHPPARAYQPPGRMMRSTGVPLAPAMSGKNTRCVAGSTATECEWSPG